MLKDLVDDRLILDTGNHFGFTCALRANRHIDVEHAFEALCPGHGLVTLFWWFILFRLRWVAPPTPDRRHFGAVFAVGGKYTVKPCQVHSRLGYQRRQLGNEIQRLEDDMRGAIAVGRFELVADIPRGRQ